MRKNKYAPLIREIFGYDSTVISSEKFIEALEALPTEAGKSLELKYVHGLTYAQVAAQMQITRAKATRYIHAGKAQLRRKLNPEFYHKEITRFLLTTY
jgi:DNA-directed RNA polymerase specialized sigma24 family protein